MCVNGEIGIGRFLRIAVVPIMFSASVPIVATEQQERNDQTGQVSTDEEHSESEKQEFLFMTEEAYTQEQNQWQLSLSSQYMERKKSKEGDEIELRNEWSWIAAIEYGLSDWLQLELAIRLGPLGTHPQSAV